MKNYYELLEVSPETPLEEITKSYFRLAATCHPDLVQRLDPEIQALANKKMRDLNLAYQVLKNPQERANYDQQLKDLEKRAMVEEEAASPPQPPPPPEPLQPKAERKKTPYPWDLVKEAALDRLKVILARSSLALKPTEGFLNPFTRIFEGKKGLTHYFVLVRIEETITPEVLNQTLSGRSLSLKVGQTWNPLQKSHSLVCLMGWGFHDLTLLKKMVRDHNRSLLAEKKGPKKDQQAFILLLDFSTEKIYAPDLSPEVTPLLAVLKEFSFREK